MFLRRIIQYVLLPAIALPPLAMYLLMGNELWARLAERSSPGILLTATEHRYGAARLQNLDYWASTRTAAPLVLFVHGGGWQRGDKSYATGREKVAHFLSRGYAVASVNYRLVPDARVEDQAADVAAALAWLIDRGGTLGFDARRIVLMGHSAGAHLVTLVGTDPAYLARYGLSPDSVRGVVALDGAAYDVPAQMEDGPYLVRPTYAEAFGDNPARQRALSPAAHVAAPNAPAFLILHIARPDGTRQSQALGQALERAGTPAEVHGFAGDGLGAHLEINRRTGDPTYPATPVLDAWLAARFAEAAGPLPPAAPKLQR